MHRGDDFAAIDALQVDRGDAEVRVTELALDDVERHTLSRHLDGMRVPELMRSEAPANTRLAAEPAEVGTDGALGPRPSGGRGGDHTGERPDRKCPARGGPRADPHPPPGVPGRPAA